MSIVVDDIPAELFIVDNVSDHLFDAAKYLTPRMVKRISPRKKDHSIKSLGVMAQRTVERYNAAYKRVYGVPAQVTYDGKWFRVMGITAGVSRVRLKEMAESLEFRAGDDHGE